MKTYVFFHGSCADGFTAAWAAWKRFGDSATYQAVQYHEAMPEVEPNSKVYLLDFSFKRAELLSWVESNNLDIVILDHHKSAEDDLKNIPYAIFDMEKSGASLAWSYFFPEEQVPPLVKYIEDRDLWKFNHEETKAVTAYLSLFKFDFEKWDSLNTELETQLEEVLAQGNAILSYIQQRAKEAEHKVSWVKIDGHSVPVLNCTHAVSETLNHLLEAFPDAKFAASFFVKPDGNFVYSLRSRKGEFDVQKLAAGKGGGGHPSAAGFMVKDMIR